MANEWEFTEDEIRDKLAELGYSNIPREKLKEFANGRLLANFENYILYSSDSLIINKTNVFKL